MITVKNISKKYGDFSALKEVSFQVKKGEILCLLGANGAGKSTHPIWQDVLVLLLINGIVLLVFGDRSLWKQNSETFLE